MKLPQGNETVLLVEDDDVVMEVVTRILQEIGYNTLTAPNGEEALQKEAEYKETIHLLFTDIIMPKMGGIELIKNILPRRPGIKILCMTGYSDEAIVNDETLKSKVGLLLKPFTAIALAIKVREILDA